MRVDLEFVGTIVIDPRNKIRDIGGAVCAYLGYYSDQLLGKDFSILTGDHKIRHPDSSASDVSDNALSPTASELQLLDCSGKTRVLSVLIDKTELGDSELTICSCFKHSEPIDATATVFTPYLRPSIFAQLVNESGTAIGFVGLDGQLIYANHRALSILGPSADSFIGRPVASFLDSELAARVLERVRRVARSGQGEEHLDLFEWRGEHEWYVSTYVPIRDAGGVVAGIQIVAQNITPLKIAQEEFRASQSRLQMVIDALHASIAVLNPDGLIVYVNAAWRAMAREQGGVDDAYLGWNYFDVCRKAVLRGDTDVGGILDGLQAVLNRQETVFEAEYPCRTPEAELWFHMIASRIEDKEAAVVVAHHDITKRKRAEQAAALQRRRIEEISQSLPAEIAYWGSDRLLKFVNNRFAAGFDLRADELVGRTLTEFFPETALEQSRGPVLQAFAGKRMTFQTRIELPSARVRDVVVELVPDADLSGHLNGCYMFLFDSTLPTEIEGRQSYSELLLSSVLENSPAAIALFDSGLQLITANSAFREQLLSALASDHDGNLLRLRDIRETQQLTRAARKVVTGRAERHSAKVAVNSAEGGTQWYRLSLAPLPDHVPDRSRLLVVCVDITDDVEKDERHRRTSEQLETHRGELERKNTAMSEILRSLEDERRLYRHEVCESIRSKLEPIQRHLRGHAGVLPAQVLARLDDIINKLSQDLMGHSFQALRARLSPREIQVCELIRQGKTSKQIAADLNLSVQTVNKHRQVIRRKLNIENSDLNLSGFLWKES